MYWALNKTILALKSFSVYYDVVSVLAYYSQPLENWGKLLNFFGGIYKFPEN